MKLQNPNFKFLKKPKFQIPNLASSYNSKLFGARKDGMTLIEVAVVVGIFIIVSGAVFSFIIYFYRSQRFAFGATAAVEEARKGLTVATREIRQAVESQAGNYTLEEAEDFSLIFYSDIDGDLGVERVHYFLDGTDFKKGIIEPQGTPATYPSGSETFSLIAQHVVSTSTPIFTYYNGDWPADTINNPLPDPVNLVATKLVQINFQFDLNPTESPKLYEVQTFAQLRNLKENL